MDVLVRLLNALLMISIPLGAGVLLSRRWGLSWRVFMIGAGTFLGSQVLHIPFNQIALVPLFDKLGLPGEDQLHSLLLYGFLLGLSAGVFEEGARYVVYHLWLRDVRQWRGAVMFGAGHGGMEAILLGGLSLYALMQAITLRGVDLEAVVPANQMEIARLQLEAYWGAPWYAALLGAAERCLALVIQISLAVFVLVAIVRRNAILLIAAILWHSFVDAVAVVGVRSWGIYWTEAAIAGLALAGLALALWLRQKMPSEETSLSDLQARAGPVSLGAPPSDSVTGEQLERSRYDEGD
jgi:uncharacterized membrane protein YhfC